MKISAFNSSNYFNQKIAKHINENQCYNAQSSQCQPIGIAFYGGSFVAKSCGYRKPKLTNESIKKVFYLTKILPKSSNIAEPRKININDEKFTYKILKDSTGRAEVEIKNNVDSLDDWNNKDKDIARTILKCNFDTKGMLVGGYFSTVEGKETIKATFKHTPKDGRQLVINDEIYKPIKKDSSKWAFVSELPITSGAEQTCNLSIRYDDNPLMSSLIELATNRTSLQLLER